MLIMECPELPPCPACGNIVDEHDDKRCDWRPVVYLPLRSVTDPDDVVGTGKGARRAVAQLPTVGKDLNDELQHGDHQSRAGRCGEGAAAVPKGSFPRSESEGAGFCRELFIRWRHRPIRTDFAFHQ